MTDFYGDSGNNTFNVTIANGSSYVDGAEGTDTLNINWSGLSAQIYGYWNGPATTGYLYEYGAGTNINFVNIERLSILFGSGADSFSVSGAGSSVSLDFGAGFDTLSTDFSSWTSALALTSSAGVYSLTGAGVNITNFESFNISGSSVNDSFAINTFSGYVSINGQGGTDSLLVDWSARSAGSYGYWDASSAGNLVDYSTGEQLSFTSIELPTLLLGSGDDNFQVTNGGGAIQLNFGAGQDTFYGDFSAVTTNLVLDLTGATFSLTGTGISVTNFEIWSGQTGSGNDTLLGSAGDDSLTGNGGTNTINAGAGNDMIYSFAPGIDTVDGGDGNDYWGASFAAATSGITMTQTGAGAYSLSNGGSLTNVEYVSVFGSEYADSFSVISTGVVTNQSNYNGAGGTDSIAIDWSAASTYSYFVLDSAGNSYGWGDYATGYDYLYTYNIENFDVTFGNGNDTFTRYANSATVHADVDGGGGDDTFFADYSSLTTGITFALAAGGATSTVIGQGDTLTNFEIVNITGGSGNDSLTGGALADTLYGLGGTNTLNGGDGDDALYTGSGGIDTIDGGAGTDIWYADFSTLTTGITMTQTGASSYSLSNGGSVNNVESAQVTGTDFNDTFAGLSGGGYFNGRGGDDTLTINWSDSTGYSYFVFDSSANAYGWKSYGMGTGYLNATSIETINLTYGVNDDTFVRYFNVAVPAGRANVNGGAGTDALVLDYSGLTTGISFALASGGATSTVVGQGDTYTNFESVQITGGSGNDSLTGGALNDNLTGGAGVNILNGGGGDDFIQTTAAGTDTIDGGAGIDQWTADFTQLATGLTVTQTGANAYSLSNGGSAVNVESVFLYGSSFNDTFTGLTGGGYFYGQGGTDTVTVDWSAATSDAYFAYTSSGTASGYRDANTVYFYSSSIETFNLTLGSGNDTFYRYFDAVNSPETRTTANGGAGNDLLNADYSTMTTGISFSLANGGGTVLGQGDVFTNFETMTFYGGSGNDTLEGASGDDTFVGGAGFDTLSYEHAAAAVSVNLAYGSPQDTGGAGIDYIFADFEGLRGSAFNDTLTGTDGANTIEGGAGNDIMSGGLGTDTVSYEHAASGVQVNLALTGAQNTLGAGTDTLSSFENVIGSAYADTFVGTSGANVFDGRAGSDTVDYSAATSAIAVSLAVTTAQAIGGGQGNDTLLAIENLRGSAYNDSLVGNGSDNLLDGGAGADAMTGGAGNDTYIVDNAGDTVTEASGAGTDTVNAAISYALTANVENLVLTGTGNTNGTGNGLANTITGNSGNNVIDGGAGADAMAGGAGNDTYVVDDAGDVVTEAVDAGTDTVNAAISYALTANVENLVLTGTGNINGTGNALNNTITGNSGNNLIDGGAGADAMAGGLGNDTYIVDNAGDTVTEASGAGTDTVNASVSFSLAGQFLENLTLTGSGNINGSGNGFDNVITGNSGNNVIDGGAGADAMAGGAGDDTYVVDNAGDTVTEANGAGTDTVNGSVSFSLTGQFLENLTLTGTGNINATGNGLANTITGNSGNNVIDGGAGADAMAGGAGNDTYIVDNTGDVVTEAAGAGTDTVNASVSYALTGNVENLTLTGTGSINGTGNTLNNTIFGNSGNNVLDGYTGADTMSGGLGNDTYYVDNVGDVVTENANEGTDTIYASISATLAANTEILRLTGTGAINGTGTGTADQIYGNSGNNVLTGLDGDDMLDGGAGADTLIGGLGNDTYYVDNVGDIVTEAAGEGTDTVVSSISYMLGAQVENLTLSGTANINGTGNALANVITGNGGNNVLDGGAGADTMAGGAGNDTYVVDDGGDVVTELASEGIDTVQSSLSYTLGVNVENLVLAGAAVAGTGNGLDNVITGNDAANLIDGGLGNDTLSGGLGIDTVTYASASGAVTVNLLSGTSSGAAGADVLSGFENIIGSAFADSLTGDGAGNVIDGGAGADTMAGGAGNDTYLVDDVGDTIVEAAGAGVDTVLASASHVLAANVENLTLTGTANINGTGNADANLFVGNSGNNVIDGGAGSDTVDYSAATSAVSVSLAVATAQAVGGGQGNDTLIAVENLVGSAFADTLTGNAADNLIDGGAGADTMAGGAGNDTYVVDNSGDKVTEANGAGTDTVISSVGFSLAGQFLENLVLTGTANINGTGNSSANVITGNAENNVIDGGTGADTMAGGLGNDTYYVDNVGDTVSEDANAGTDTVITGLSYALGANIENLTLTGTGNVNATGNALNNVITGNAGNNVIDGGAGADTMSGGAGNDTYYVDNAADVVVEASDAGTDTVNASVSFNLSGQFLENLVLTGTANINATGNGLNNVLTGNSGSNVLNGGGGADTMAGGAGDDTYYVDNAGDTVSEGANAGTDTVNASITFSLAGQHIENLILTGSSNINGTGNSLANVITGNAGNNVIDGGAGADTMIGGLGNDTYIVDNAGDVVTEDSAAGTDTVQASVSHTLSANVENLTLTGTAAINGTGNGLANVIIGNAGNNVIDGGAGADTMSGGAGNDTYYVDNTADVVVEANGAGTDQIFTSVSYSLAGQFTENITLTGTQNYYLTGNGLDNVMRGNSGINSLSGGAGNDSLYGGLGADTLSGGAGADGFYFDTTLGGGNIDTISDFVAVDDTIYLDDAIFGGLAVGTLAASAFAIGSSASSADTRIFYNSATGGLFYDADGSGSGAAVQFAAMTSGLVLTNADFVVA